MPGAKRWAASLTRFSSRCCHPLPKNGNNLCTGLWVLVFLRHHGHQTRLGEGHIDRDQRRADERKAEETRHQMRAAWHTANRCTALCIPRWALLRCLISPAIIARHLSFPRPLLRGTLRRGGDSRARGKHTEQQPADHPAWTVTNITIHHARAAQFDWLVYP